MVEQVLLTLSLVAIVVSIAALALGVYGVVRARASKRAQAAIAAAVAEGNFAAVIGRLSDDVEGIHKTNERLDKAIKKTWRKSEGCVQRVGLVRYDALEELAGQLSFSAALLNDAADGVVITTLNGRNDTRTWAKPVTSGESPFTLSDEERQAIRKAMTEGPGGTE